MSRYQPYPKYRESGIEWLGDVPEQWEVKSLKYFAKLNPPKSEVQKQRGLECSFVPMEKLKTGSIELDVTKQIEEVYDGYTYFQNNDILLAKVTPCFENRNIAIAADLNNGIGFGSSEIYVVRASDFCDRRYLYYAVQEETFMKLGISYMTGTGGLKRVPSEFLNNAKFPFPDVLEQTAIANFLDRETAKIDTLIAKQERMIELLNEKRSALISHAVTKGLDPNVPMKDSGVEWLGEVPEHWEIIQSRRLFAERKERAKKDDEQLTASQKYGIISQAKFMELENRRVMQVITGAEILKHVEPNDFVISMRSFQGGLEWCKLVGSVSSAYIALIPIKNVVPKYFAYLFKCEPYIKALQSTSNLIRDGQALRFENFSLVNLMIVPENEQSAIAIYLDMQTSKIDALIAKAREAIELMKERRSALVSSAVTGKIDVRGMA